MACAATNFLSALNETQHAAATFAFTHEERQRWHYIPPEQHPRGGITLNALGQERFARDPEEHYLAVFGNPEASGTWGFRFEGHHISLNYARPASSLAPSARN